MFLLFSWGSLFGVAKRNLLYTDNAYVGPENYHYKYYLHWAIWSFGSRATSQRFRFRGLGFRILRLIMQDVGLRIEHLGFCHLHSTGGVADLTVGFGFIAQSLFHR